MMLLLLLLMMMMISASQPPSGSYYVHTISALTAYSPRFLAYEERGQTISSGGC
jgi:hypothetical protein